MSIPSASKTYRTHLIVLLVVCLLTFFNSLANDLVWDDIPLIAENVNIRDGGHIPLFLTPGYWNEQHPYPGHYRPLRAISLAVDYFFWGLNPTGYRLTNILLHIVNVLLVYFLAAVIGRRKTGDLAFLTALFFATHPVHTESVNLVKNRSDMLALMFFLLSFLLFAKHLSASKKSSRWMLFGAWCCFIPAVLSKEMALTLPGTLVLYIVCFLTGPERRRAMARIIPYLVMIAGYFWFMHTFITAAQPPPAGAALPSGPIQHAGTVIKTIGIYLKMLTVPYPLNAEHAFAVPGSLSDPAVLASLAVLLLVLIITVNMYDRAPVVSFGLGWILLTLVPAANLVYLVSRPVAEQRLYIPSFGFCLLLGYSIARLTQVGAGRWKRRRPVVAGRLLALLIVVLYAGLVIERNRDWRDEITFYTRTLAANPDSARMHNNLGIVLNKNGRYAEAIRHYQAALELYPDYAKPRLNLGVALCNTGQWEEAVSHFQAGLLLITSPDNKRYAGIYNNLGVALMKLGQLDQSDALFRKVLTMDPDNISATYNLGGLLMVKGDFKEAASMFYRVLCLDPAHEPAGREYQYCRKMVDAGTVIPPE